MQPLVYPDSPLPETPVSPSDTDFLDGETRHRPRFRLTEPEPETLRDSIFRAAEADRSFCEWRLHQYREQGSFPDIDGQHRVYASPGFMFACVLKARQPRLADLPRWRVANLVDAELANLFPDVEEEDRWGELLGGTIADPVLGETEWRADQDIFANLTEPREVLIDVWADVEPHNGYTRKPMPYAVELARLRPITSPDLRSKPDQRYLFAVSIVYHLSQILGGQLNLGGEELGDVVGVADRQANRYLKRMEGDGLIAKAPGCPRSPYDAWANKKTFRYKWVGRNLR